MEKLVTEIINLNYEDIPNHVFPKNKLIGLVVNFHDDVKYEFLLNLQNVDNLLVIGSGLRGNQKKIDTNRPVFHRWSWKFNESTIFYNDPTIYINPNLEGGWGVGTPENYYLKNIALIIKEIAKNIKINNDHIYFYGSSQGGFMSMVLSIFFKDSISIAEVPQFDVSLFSKKHWRNLKEYCFEGLDDEEIKEKFGERIDIIKLIKKENYIPKTYLILDVSSEWELNSSIIPFFKRLTELPFADYQNHIKIRLDGKNKGHAAQEYGGLIETITRIINLEEQRNNIDMIPSSLEKYVTARVDIKNFGNENNSIEIIDISDDNCTIEYPLWLKNNTGTGLKIESSKGKLDIKLKPINDGIIYIKLLGIDFVKNKRFPIYINFNKLIINNETILNESILTCHDMPYGHSMKVKNNEIIDLSIEWTPLK